MNSVDRCYKQSKETELAFLPHVYEIHGNVRYMHCSDEEADCSKKFYAGPTLNEFRAYEASQANDKVKKTLVPSCNECGKIMKPHCMFFDEAYNEHYYRYDTILDFCNDADCLVVIGTALATTGANNIVKSFIVREQPVIEVNLESAIKRGFNI